MIWYLSRDGGKVMYSKKKLVKGKMELDDLDQHITTSNLKDSDYDKLDLPLTMGDLEERSNKGFL